MHCFVYFGKMASNELEAIKYSKDPDTRCCTRKRQISGRGSRAEESLKNRISPLRVLTSRSGIPITFR